MQHEYGLIQAYYGSRTAERSGIPLMNHIDEGLAILDGLGASETAKAAYCLHPLVQNEVDLRANIHNLANDPLCSVDALFLALEYRLRANAYLCRPATDHMTLGIIKATIYFDMMGEDVKHMLIADKQQNYKDFMAAHYGTHPRSEQLHTYFNNWFKILGVEPLPT